MNTTGTIYTMDFRSYSRCQGQTKEISIIEHAGSYGSVMNLLEIWAEGEIKGFLSAEQTLRIIKNIRERESPN